jgi:hypothetical protein
MGAAFSNMEQSLTELTVSFTDDYDCQHEKLQNLYEKGKKEQWNSSDELDWSISVDIENTRHFPEKSIIIYGSDIWAKMTPPERKRLLRENLAYRLSNALHGEQGALIATAQLTVSLPTIDAKLYSSTQVMDEGRHVEVFQRYLKNKMELSFPIDPNLQSLLEMIFTDNRWDIKYLGMQIIVEGLGLTMYGLWRTLFTEPLLRKLLTFVSQDEARHVAFGLIALSEFYCGLSAKELREREEFAYQACSLLYNQAFGTIFFERLGLPKQQCLDFFNNSSQAMISRQVLFSRLLPYLKKLGLLSEQIRPHYEKLGILQCEDAPI